MLMHFRNMKLDRRLKCNIDVGFVNVFKSDCKAAIFPMYKQNYFNIIHLRQLRLFCNQNDIS